jgi:hypothetical protein
MLVIRGAVGEGALGVTTVRLAVEMEDRMEPLGAVGVGVATAGTADGVDIGAVSVGTVGAWCGVASRTVFFFVGGLLEPRGGLCATLPF